jgi:hypothetical protein
VTEQERQERIAELVQRIAAVRARLPKHSPPTSMMVDIDEMEDELATLSEEQDRSNEADMSQA